MEAQKLLETPKAKPKIVARVSKVNNLVEVSTQARKSSLALRKTFEKGIYQRKTQLSVLNRYKKRLDTINKEQDKKFEKKTKEKPKKIKIPKFKGSFFTKGSSDDPLKAIGALAAFNSLEKLLEGDLLGALSPGMVAAGALLGPGLLGLVGGAADGFFSRGPKPTRDYGNNLGWERAKQGRYGDKGAWSGAQKDIRERYARRYGDKAASRKFSGDVAQTTVKGARAGKAFARFGSALIPGVGAVVGAADAAMRAQAGDQFGAGIAGTGAALDAAAAASAATGIGLPIAGLLSIASFALDATNLIRDLTGQSAAEEEKNTRLKEQTKKEKELSRSGSLLTFSKTLVSYGKAVAKFEEFAKGATGTFDPSNPYNEQDTGPPPQSLTGPGGAYDGPISGETFFPLPGGDVGTRGTISDRQKFGASRDGGTRSHMGLDMTHWSGPLNAPVSAYKTGKVVRAVHAGYRGSVDIDHGGGLYTRYVHVVPSVSVGQIVYGGQQIATLYPDGQNTHLHFEVYQGSSARDPSSILTGVKNRITSPLSLERAKEHDSSQAGANEGMVVNAPKTGQLLMVHGKEAIIPIDNYHTASGGDPLKNVSPEIVNSIISKSKIYQTAMAEMPPEVITVPMPISPPQVQYVSSGSGGNLNIQDDADKRILKMLYYSVLG